MVNVGRVLYGYCGGFFSRLEYEDKRIEAEGYDWVVVRSDDGRVDFEYFTDHMEKQRLINSWSAKDRFE